jgi:hypothetical protein
VPDWPDFIHPAARLSCGLLSALGRLGAVAGGVLLLVVEDALHVRAAHPPERREQPTSPVTAVRKLDVHRFAADEFFHDGREPVGVDGARMLLTVKPTALPAWLVVIELKRYRHGGTLRNAPALFLNLKIVRASIH